MVCIFLLTCVPAGVCTLQVASGVALARVLDLLSNVRHGISDPERLMECILAHLDAFKAAYDELGWVPKHRLAIHLADKLMRFGVLLNLLTQERKHRVFVE